MILPTTETSVWILAIVSLLFLGSWANTLKLAGKWRFEYYYYDFVIGIMLGAGIAVLLLGSARPQELTFQDNFLLAGYRKIAWALGSGVVLNLGTLLLLAAMTIAGMSVAFPLTFGVALSIGAVWDFVNAQEANIALTFVGFGLLVTASVVVVLAYRRRLRVLREASQKALTPDPRVKSKRPKTSGVVLMVILAVVGGAALSAFPKILGESITGDNGLSPYGAFLMLAVSALFSAPFFVLVFTTFPVVGAAGSLGGYFAGNKKQHALGVTGGAVCGAGLLMSLMVTAAPKELQLGTLIQYPLQNAVLLVAAVWGLLGWREFAGVGQRGQMLLTGMMVLFLVGLAMVAVGLSSK